MDLHLSITNYVGSLSTLLNGLFIILISILPPNNLGIFRSQYYVGAFASFFFSATQLWTANIYYPNGTLFILFSARHTGRIGFTLFAAAINLQFMILSSNFVARYAAVRGRVIFGRIRVIMTNSKLFYGSLLLGVLGGCVPPIVLLSPTSSLRDVARATCAGMFAFDFMSEYYFICSYEFPTCGSTIFHNLIFVSVVLFQATNLLMMLVCGVATYVHISKHTMSQKLREVNNRLLLARSVQAIFSLLFLFMPGLVINASMLLRLDASSIAPMLSSSMSLGTLFNPFVDIALTTEYRTRIMCLLFPNSAMLYRGSITVSTINKSSTRSIINHVR